MASTGPATLSRGLKTTPSRSFVKRFDPLKQQKSVGDETEQTADETTSSDTSEMIAKEYVVSNNLPYIDHASGVSARLSIANYAEAMTYQESVPVSGASHF